jgi:hypothetical protein
MLKGMVVPALSQLKTVWYNKHVFREEPFLLLFFLRLLVDFFPWNIFSSGVAKG